MKTSPIADALRMAHGLDIAREYRARLDALSKRQTLPEKTRHEIRRMIGNVDKVSRILAD